MYGKVMPVRRLDSPLKKNADGHCTAAHRIGEQVRSHDVDEGAEGHGVYRNIGLSEVNRQLRDVRNERDRDSHGACEHIEEAKQDDPSVPESVCEVAGRERREEVHDVDNQAVLFFTLTVTSRSLRLTTFQCHSKHTC